MTIARRTLCTFGIAMLILASHSPVAFAAKIRATIYDDGLSCPAGCDAHVVFASSLNGTANAHAPNSPEGRFEKCAKNTECHICFDSTPSSCMVAMYRGNGPHADTFDLTPAFYETHCPKPGIPAALEAKCRSLALEAKSLDGRINCVRNPDHAKCKDLITKARERQTRDRPLYEECVRSGEKAFNKNRPVSEQRSNECAYEKKGTGGPNRKGKTWRRLLPGACRENTYVGRDGLDCCGGNPLADGPLGLECIAFYPKP